jgi:hypothetical protein
MKEPDVMRKAMQVLENLREIEAALTRIQGWAEQMSCDGEVKHCSPNDENDVEVDNAKPTVRRRTE